MSTVVYTVHSLLPGSFICLDMGSSDSGFTHLPGLSPPLHSFPSNLPTSLPLASPHAAGYLTAPQPLPSPLLGAYCRKYRHGPSLFPCV